MVVEFNSPLAVVAAAVVVLCSCVALYLRRARASYPSWDAIPEDTLKVGGSKKRLEEFASAGPIDYIIVGSGLGGLTCASLLAKVGYRVLVLEQHDIAGGATHTFSEQGFTWDVGVHYCGERLASRWSPVRRLFDAASDGKLEWSACHEDYDHAVNMQTSEDIPMNRDPAKKLRRLRASFPNVPAGAWDRYRRACRVAQLASGGAFVAMKVLPRWLVRLLGPVLLFPAYSWAAGRTAKEVMANCGLSNDAIGGASYLYGDYGLPPGEAPFLVQALLETHYDGGGYFPRGGSGSIAKTIVAAIVRRGGAVVVRAPVSEITVTNRNGRGNRATGVVCRGVELKARHGVISNAGAFNTYERLLPPAVAAPALDALRATPGAFEPSVQLVYLFVGLDGSDAELELPGANFWLLHGWDHDANWERLKKAESYEALGFLPAVFLSFGSAKDDHHATVPANARKATLQLLAPVRLEWFNGVAKEGSKVKHRGAAYDALKEVWRDRLLEDYLFRKFPQCRGRVAFTSVATPLTTNFYLNTLRGESYGLAHTTGRFSSGVQVEALHTAAPDVGGLSMVGQDVFSVGVVGALASGAITSAFLSPASLVRLGAELLFA